MDGILQRPGGMAGLMLLLLSWAIPPLITALIARRAAVIFRHHDAHGSTKDGIAFFRGVISGFRGKVENQVFRR